MSALIRMFISKSTVYGLQYQQPMLRLKLMIKVLQAYADRLVSALHIQLLLNRSLDYYRLIVSIELYVYAILKI